jgi:hypothetical protein
MPSRRASSNLPCPSLIKRGRFDKKEVEGRTINVEIAKPPSNTARPSLLAAALALVISSRRRIHCERGSQGSRRRTVYPGPRGHRHRRRSHQARASPEARPRSQGLLLPPVHMRCQLSGQRGGAARGGDRVPADGEAEGGAPQAPAPAQEQPATNGTAEEGSVALERLPGPAEARAFARSGERGAGRGRGRGRGRPARRGPPVGEPSKTLLFIANLPFGLDKCVSSVPPQGGFEQIHSDGLKAVFEGYNVANAHVVVRKYGPVKGRSKGFGFVEVGSSLLSPL